MIAERLTAIEAVLRGSLGTLTALLVTRRGLTRRTISRLRQQHEEAARLLRELEELL